MNPLTPLYSAFLGQHTRQNMFQVVTHLVSSIFLLIKSWRNHQHKPTRRETNHMSSLMRRHEKQIHTLLISDLINFSKQYNHRYISSSRHSTLTDIVSRLACTCPVLWYEQQFGNFRTTRHLPRMVSISGSNILEIWLSLRPPLRSSGQSSWLQIRRPGFDSRHYQKKK
jgi:hypothetical protein